MKLTEINGAKILHYHMVQVIFGDQQIRNLQGKISMVSSTDALGRQVASRDSEGYCDP